jgi:peptidoglycan/LPS O-acetylase OafA/YrhL
VGPWWVGNLCESGPAAAGFFFLLSGFVLALHHPAVPDRKRFWRARLLRIYPMYLFAFLLFFPIAVGKYYHDPVLLVASMAVNLPMLQSWTNLSQSWNGPSWSLSVEAFLYLMFPLLVRRIGRFGNLAAWSALAVAPTILTIGFCAQWIPAATWRSWIGNNPVFWLPLFCFGMALGLRRDKTSPATKPSMDVPIFASLALVPVLAVFWPARYREMLINGGAVLLFGVIILLCTFHSPVTEKIFGNPLMDRLGKASYITYIVQAPLWHYFVAFVNLMRHQALSDSISTVPLFLLFVLILVGASLCLDAYFDEPVRAWFNRRRRPAAAVPASIVPSEATGGVIAYVDSSEGVPR